MRRVRAALDGQLDAQLLSQSERIAFDESLGSTLANPSAKSVQNMKALREAGGAGKSTLYRNELQDRLPSVEFVNADELAMRHFGHAAHTPEESRMGQRLADERRDTLMAAHQSLITESTFSHPSKLELLQQAQAAGYRVFVYHAVQGISRAAS